MRVAILNLIQRTVFIPLGMTRGNRRSYRTHLTHCLVLFVNTKHTKMTSIRRPPGRPSKGLQDRPFQMRVSEGFLRMVDDWRRCQKDLPSRAEAIRRLVELAVRLKTPPERDS